MSPAESPEGAAAPTQTGPVFIEFERALLRGNLDDELFWARQAGRWAHLLSEEGEPDRGGLPDPDTLPVNSGVAGYAATAMARGREVVLLVRNETPEAARLAAEMTAGAEIVQGEAAIGDRIAAAGGGELVSAGGPVGGLALTDPRRLDAGAGTVPWGALARALRPHQWMKNLLVFVPMLAAHRLDWATLGQALTAFVAFCLVASSVYVLNDLLDLAADRAHPRKRRRPFASGDLPLAAGRWLAPGLLAAGLLVAVLGGPALLGVILAYFGVTLLYTFWLKRRTIIDICALAGLYTLRLVAGSAATGIELSVWLLAFSVFLFLALAALKRQAELQDALGRGKAMAMGRGYRTEDVGLISQMALSAGYVAVLVLALYLNSDSVRELYSQPAALWGMCLVLLYWLSRAVMKAHRGELDDDPLIFAVRDNVSRICILLMLGFAVLGAVL